MNRVSRILAINGGSSSVKFALFDSETMRRETSGRIEGIEEDIGDADGRRAAESLIDRLAARVPLRNLDGVGHRIVHGGAELREHQRVTPDLLRKLSDARPLDPTHLPLEISLIEAMARAAPDVPQVTCFDSAFFRDLPRVAQLLAIPRAYLDRGIRRLGFHGLSYAYLRDELRRTAGDRAADGRVILAHLGSGASLAALRGGKPVDTTMAFTPAAGLVMGTRPGDLDPGLLVHLLRSEQMSADALDVFVNQECGLRGVSGTTSDMKELEERAAADPRAAEAIALFCYQAAKAIGAFAAVLGSLDTIVFSGGIGERSALARREICARLEFLNALLDAASNEAHAAVISAPSSRVAVRVIPTDEEIVMARIVRELLKEDT
jgi:acetate kinase